MKVKTYIMFNKKIVKLTIMLLILLTFVSFFVLKHTYFSESYTLIEYLIMSVSISLSISTMTFIFYIFNTCKIVFKLEEVK